MVEKRNDHRVLVGKSKRKRTPDRLRHRWRDIKLDLKGRMGECGLNSSGSR
jgi:hypothetical protein